jgi:hypothetical protein
MITYAEALEAVELLVGFDWQEAGTFYADPAGYEDAKGYLVPIGAREWLVERKRDFIVHDDRVIFVAKDDGEITESSYMLEMARIDRMRPVKTTP